MSGCVAETVHPSKGKRKEKKRKRKRKEKEGGKKQVTKIEGKRTGMPLKSCRENDAGMRRRARNLLKPAGVPEELCDLALAVAGGKVRCSRGDGDERRFLAPNADARFHGGEWARACLARLCDRVLPRDVALLDMILERDMAAEPTIESVRKITGQRVSKSGEGGAVDEATRKVIAKAIPFTCDIAIERFSSGEILERLQRKEVSREELYRIFSTSQGYDAATLDLLLELKGADALMKRCGAAKPLEGSKDSKATEAVPSEQKVNQKSNPRGDEEAPLAKEALSGSDVARMLRGFVLDNCSAPLTIDWMLQNANSAVRFMESLVRKSGNTPGSWQDVSSDIGTREGIVRKVVEYLARQNQHDVRSADLSVAIEETLYKAAKSKQEYLDESTLSSRIAETRSLLMAGSLPYPQSPSTGTSGDDLQWPAADGANSADGGKGADSAGSQLASAFSALLAANDIPLETEPPSKGATREYCTAALSAFVREKCKRFVDVDVSDPQNREMLTAGRAREVFRDLDEISALFTTKLKLSTKSLGVEAAEIVCKKISSMVSLRDADVSDIIAGRETSIGLHVLELVGGALSESRYLRSVDWSENALGPRGIRVLAHFFKSAARACEA